MPSIAKTLAIPARVAAVMLVVASFLVPPPALAADELTGEILDMACYIGRGLKGPSHERCAQRCAERGMPLGLLGEDGKVYLLYPRHGKEAAFDTVKQLAGRDAKLSGKITEYDGLFGFEVHTAAPAE